MQHTPFLCSHRQLQRHYPPNKNASHQQAYLHHLGLVDNIHFQHPIHSLQILLASKPTIERKKIKITQPIIKKLFTQWLLVYFEDKNYDARLP